MVNKGSEAQKLELVQGVDFEQLSKVAHDISSPLAALRIIFKDIQELSDEQKSLVDEAFLRINDIVKDIRVNCQKIAKENSCLLDKEIKKVLLEKKLEYKQRKDVQFKYTRDASRFLKGNLPSSDFKRVLSNLINNAIEAKDKETVCVEIKLKEHGGGAFVEVVDNGCGIEEEQLPRLFRKSYTRKKKTGLGLGLYQVKETLQKHGASIKVASIPKLGSYFKIIL